MLYIYIYICIYVFMLFIQATTYVVHIYIHVYIHVYIYTCTYTKIQKTAQFPGAPMASEQDESHPGARKFKLTEMNAEAKNLDDENPCKRPGFPIRPNLQGI